MRYRLQLLFKSRYAASKYLIIPKTYAARKSIKDIEGNI